MLTFTNATYQVPTVGRDWSQSDKGRAQPNYDMFADSILPIIEAALRRPYKDLLAVWECSKAPATT